MLFILITLCFSAIALVIYLILYIFSEKPAPPPPFVPIPKTRKLAVNPQAAPQPITREKFEITDELFEKLEQHLCQLELIKKVKIDLDEQDCLTAIVLPDFDQLRHWWESMGNAWISLDDMLSYTEDENHIMLLNRHPEFMAKYRALIHQVNKRIAGPFPISFFSVVSRVQWMEAMGEPLPALYS
ncbi:MAG: hypothetical protein D6730_09025 [Bacteroidetes bacterium]|nr:MAG: hypothetical protein D6730_09025 [Bacteroidota bacterium]